MPIMDGISVMMLRSRIRRVTRNKKLSEGNKTRKIEQMLRRSKLPALARLYREDPDSVSDSLAMILGTDTCSMCAHSCDAEFERRVESHLVDIRGYSQLIGTVEGLRRIPYNADNIQHEDMLMQLWERLCPEKQLRARITRQWTDIGFQGRNPRTDFRGMGMLGLHNLLFFASQYPDKARELLTHSRNEKYGYSFAIVGINMTSLAYNLLCQDLLKPYMYNMVSGPARLHDFHNFYCYLLCEFDRFWVAEKPTDLMQFTSVKSRFEKKMLAQLSAKDISISHGFVLTDIYLHNKHLQTQKQSTVTDVCNTNDILNTSYYLWV